MRTAAGRLTVVRTHRVHLMRTAAGRLTVVRADREGVR
jgi:hypothetical protein